MISRRRILIACSFCALLGTGSLVAILLLRVEAAPAPGDTKVPDLTKPLLRFGDRKKGVGAVTFSPDGKKIVSCELRTNDIRIHDALTGKELLAFPEVKVGVNSVAYCPDPKRPLVAVAGGFAAVLDVSTGKPAVKLDPAPDFQALFVAFSPDGSLLAVGGDQTREKRVAEGRERVYSKGIVGLYDTATGKEVRIIDTGEKQLSALAFSPDGQRLATASPQGNVTVWDRQTGKTVLTLHPGRHEVSAVAFSPDGKWVAAGINDFGKRDDQGTIRVWDARSGDDLFSLPGHKGLIRCLAFAPGGCDPASAGGGEDRVNGMVKVWDARSKKLVVNILPRDHAIHALAYSPDGGRLAVGTDAVDGPGEVTIWDVGKYCRDKPEK